MSAGCHAPIEFEALIAYWLGELPPAVEEPLEEHLFTCAHCTRELEIVSAFATGIRAAVRDGKVATVISKAFLEQMKQLGMRIREYAPPSGGSVNCTITDEDDLIVSRLRAPLAGVKRLDAMQTIDVGGERVAEMRVEDVPFDPEAGEVLFVPSSTALRKLPAHTARVALIAVEESGERLLGNYAFAHSST